MPLARQRLAAAGGMARPKDAQRERWLRAERVELLRVVRADPVLDLARQVELGPRPQVEDEDARVEAVLLEGQRLLVALLEARLAAAGGGWRCESRWSWWSVQVEASRWLVSPAACRL